MKPANFNFKNKHTNRLFLLLCVFGVVLVAWWAWAAGPIHPKSAIRTSQINPVQPKLSAPGNSQLKTAPPVSGSSTSTPVSVPGTAVSAQPSYPLCRLPRAGIQPDIAYVCNCGSPGIQLACPESTY